MNFKIIDLLDRIDCMQGNPKYLVKAVMVGEPSTIEQGFQYFHRVKILNTAPGQVRVKEVEDTERHTCERGPMQPVTTSERWKSQ